MSEIEYSRQYIEYCKTVNLTPNKRDDILFSTGYALGNVIAGTELQTKVEQLEQEKAKLVELLSDAYEEGWYYPEMYKDNKDPDFNKSSTKQKLEKIKAVKYERD